MTLSLVSAESSFKQLFTTFFDPVHLLLHLFLDCFTLVTRHFRLSDDFIYLTIPLHDFLFIFDRM